MSSGEPTKFVRKPENVHEYPRPPAIEKIPGVRLRVVWSEPGSDEQVVIADTTSAYRILETTHCPTYYFPTSDVNMSLLTKETSRKTYCEWKGVCHYYVLNLPSGKTVKNRIFTYPNAEGTNGKYKAIAGYISFYATSGTDAKTQGAWTAYIDDEVAQPQPGDFYSGWMDQYVRGKVKGGPGTWGW